MLRLGDGVSGYAMLMALGVMGGYNEVGEGTLPYLPSIRYLNVPTVGTKTSSREDRL